MVKLKDADFRTHAPSAAPFLPFPCAIHTSTYIIYKFKHLHTLKNAIK